MDIPKDFLPPSEALFEGRDFHPVIHLPEVYDIYDFSQTYDSERKRREFGVGRYNEHRPTMYSQEMYQESSEEPRTVHMGIDIGAPAGTPIYSFTNGVLLQQADHQESGNYGPTLVTEHEVGPGLSLYVLWGHLSRNTLSLKKLGAFVTRGELLGFVGQKEENGGWNPHLHFQLSWIPPTNADLPGVVALSQRTKYRKIFPDPRLVLGPLY